jgi:hypothetical protein
MKTKTIALFTLAAALLIAASTFALSENPAAGEQEIECELVITPKGSTVVKGGDVC